MDVDDSELAFKLQVEEALAASAIDTAIPLTNAAALDPEFLEDDYLERCQQELLDQQVAEAEAKRLRLDLSRQIYDRALACEIENVPEPEWAKNGDNLNRPYGEGSSNNNPGLSFRVYVKGLLEQTMGGVGVAICDGNDGLVFELNKGCTGKRTDGEFVRLKALLEGLNLSVLLDLKSISIVTDSTLIYNYIIGQEQALSRNVASLCDQINLLLRNFTHISASYVATNEVKFAVELARNAIFLQVNRSAGSSNDNTLPENCAICFEDTYADQMFVITGCLHRYCFSCMSKHVQFRLLQGFLPICPHEKCKSELKLDSCKMFLTPELFDILSQRVKEASIPAANRVYCPYPKCSTLLSKTEIKGSIGNSGVVTEVLGGRKCPKCRGIFCINCKVPWHDNMKCADFKRRNPYPFKEDKKLKVMATENNWRQCPECKHMVSLAQGCYHIYCRCGHEFCYKCGAQWMNKKATCACPIWDERNIVYDR